MKTKYLAFLMFFPLGAIGKDITQQIVDNTDYDEQVSALCTGSCGNKGWSRLESVSLVSAGQGFYSVTAKGAAAFHQANGSVTFLGRQITPPVNVKYQIDVAVFGTLNSHNCLLKVDHIRVKGDKLGLTKGVKNEIGKTHKIADCQQFL